MIALPVGITVYAGGRAWTKEIPEGFCPEHLKPVPVPVKGKGKDTDCAEPT